MSLKRHIPNAITCGNILCGCMAVLCAFQGNLLWAALFMLVGAGFDFFDGMMARLLGVFSPMGRELDSLADVITFGLAPSVMLYTALRYLMAAAVRGGELGDGQLWLAIALPYVGFGVVVFSALRLAKYNVDERQAMNFIGLPTPANALFWGALLTSGFSVGVSPLATAATYVLLIGVMCWLLISELPMMAFKFKHWGWKGNELRYALAAVVLVLVASFGAAGWGMAGISVAVLAYVLFSAIAWSVGSHANAN